MPRYEFKCTSDECGKVHEFQIKLIDYDKKRHLIRCPYCNSKMNRTMDFNGSFELRGAGWFGKEGTGTGYEITQNEMDRNGDQNKFLEDKL